MVRARACQFRRLIMRARAVISRATGPSDVVVTLPPGWEDTDEGQE
jgi:hypothetical protein